VWILGVFLSENAVFTRLADTLLTVCGTGNILVTGESVAECRSVLWQRNIRVESAASLRDALRSPLGEIDTVFCLDLLDTDPSEETTLLLNQLYKATPRYVCVYASLDPGNAVNITQCYEQWERIFFEAGFRRHPRLFHALGYQDREHPPVRTLLIFERIPESVLARFSLQRLHDSRLLHMDMLRDTGRRSDAHLMRYFMASSSIRPGDTVLDCACGLGYGSYVLYNNSRARRVIGVDSDAYAMEYAKSNYADPGFIDFEAADAQNLSAFADNSFDFIVGFETIEHLPEPKKYLQELFRVLRPSGRIMISAPDRWVDETGKDPNPHHFHVYTWDRLYAEVASLFLPEKGFVQIAGGALKLPRGTRQWREIPCKPGQLEEAEWVIVTAMKDPLLGRHVPYVETTFPDSDDSAWHMGAYGKEYLNPWLLKGMIHSGYRLKNAALLESMSRQVLETYPADSVDYGAALCVLVYQQLARSIMPEGLEALMKRVKMYAALPPANPHVMRWQVSLLFAAALSRRKYGELEEAEALFMRCAAVDVFSYSPLLGNKTLDALYSAAMLALARVDVATARERLKLALEEAIRLVQGGWINVILDPQTPWEAGFPEVAQLMDKASRCCYMLGELDTYIRRPGLARSRGKGWYEAAIEHLTHQAADTQSYTENLLQSIECLKSQVAGQAQQIAEHCNAVSCDINLRKSRLARVVRLVSGFTFLKNGKSS